MFFNHELRHCGSFTLGEVMMYIGKDWKEVVSLFVGTLLAVAVVGLFVFLDLIPHGDGLNMYEIVCLVVSFMIIQPSLLWLLNRFAKPQRKNVMTVPVPWKENEVSDFEAFSDMLTFIVKERRKVRQSEDEMIKEICETCDIPYSPEIVDATDLHLIDSRENDMKQAAVNKAWQRYCYSLRLAKSLFGVQ